MPALPAASLNPPSALEDALAGVERHMDALSAHLLAGDAPALEHSSAALRQALAVLAPHLAGPRGAAALAPAAAQRLQRLGPRLATQRQALARLAAAADRQTASLLPQSAGAGATDSRTLGGRSAAGGMARLYRSAS